MDRGRKWAESGRVKPSLLGDILKALKQDWEDLCHQGTEVKWNQIPSRGLVDVYYLDESILALQSLNILFWHPENVEYVTAPSSLATVTIPLFFDIPGLLV